VILRRWWSRWSDAPAFVKPETVIQWHRASKLSRLKGLTVAARTSAARFKGANQSPSEIGTALGVAWLLEGAVLATFSIRKQRRLLGGSHGEGR